METLQPVYFCFGAKPANSKFATKTARKKKNNEKCHIINNLLTELARAVLGNIGPRLWLIFPSTAFALG